MVCSVNRVEYEKRRSGSSEYLATEREQWSESGRLPSALPSPIDRLHHCHRSRHGLQLYEDHHNKELHQPKSQKGRSSRCFYFIMSKL